MDRRVFVASESDERHFALLFGLRERFRRAVRANEEIGIVLERDSVDLPKIEMVGLKTPERFFQHAESEFAIASVAADFRHQEHLIADARETLAHPLLRFSAV